MNRGRSSPIGSSTNVVLGHVSVEGATRARCAVWDVDVGLVEGWIRILFAFDSKRRAILLVAGDKSRDCSR